MNANRREFLGQVTATAAAFAVLPQAAAFAREANGTGPAGVVPPPGDAWDLSWTRRVTGKHRTVFDVPEVDSAYGVWRATFWAQQYADVLKAAPKDITTVVVLRHNGVLLAMQQAYWDKYGVAAAHKVTHPATQQPTDRNPALLSAARGEIPEQFDALSLDKLIARGGIALACDLALRFAVVPEIAAKDGVSAEEAHTRATSLMVPGVILQPSGIFAAVRAQELGCNYVRAS